MYNNLFEVTIDKMPFYYLFPIYFGKNYYLW